MAVISLRGWHPAIAREEAAAMFPEACIERTAARRLLTVSDGSDWNRVDVMSGTECVLVAGGICEWTNLGDLIEQIEFEGKSSMAVECWRHEGKLPISTREVEKKLGALFFDAGAEINLTNPTNRFGVVLDASANMVAWGWMVGPGPGKQGWSAMRANKRPFFRPVSIEPRLARAAVNIAAGPHTGFVVDPMCGTGGILIESALSGRPTIGVDFDQVMAQGSRENLAWAKAEAEVVCADATTFVYPENLAAVVVDPPYGRNSQGEEELLSKTLFNLHNQHPDAGLVVILPAEPGGENLDEKIESEIQIPGYKIKSAFGIPVHKSLTRIMIFASNALQD